MLMGPVQNSSGSAFNLTIEFKSGFYKFATFEFMSLGKKRVCENYSILGTVFWGLTGFELKTCLKWHISRDFCLPILKFEQLLV